ncbi:AbfB domain-containing protein [Streptomyces sp. NPDC058086]|uniref:AbfB domain-containing protein n=1 Tax=Streptomyces sp. NPDC058086 TaxID=3346334 RepID=UPI0036E863F7
MGRVARRVRGVRGRRRAQSLAYRGASCDELSDAANPLTSGVSFESYSRAGRYLRHYDYLLYTQPTDTTLARADATSYAE